MRGSDEHWVRYTWTFTDGIWETQIGKHRVQYTRSYKNPSSTAKGGQQVGTGGIWWKLDDGEWRCSPARSMVEANQIIPVFVQDLISWGYID